VKLLALGFIAAAAAMVPVMVGAAPASAQPAQWDPQTTNVPYLAWVGEEIRLNKCVTVDGITSESDLVGVSASFLVEDWGGVSSTLPQIEPNTVSVYYSSDFDGGAGGVCAVGDIVSLFPGPARVELDVTDSFLPELGPLLKHQFLAAWMTYNTPTLTELSSTSFAPSAAAEAGRELGDPSGNGEFNAGAGSGYLDFKVTGSIPLNPVWTALLGESTVTLPNDWPLLASKLATDDVNGSNPVSEWNTSGEDTAGDFLGELGTGTPPDPCSPVPAQFASIPSGPHYVDDCTGGGADGPFGTVFGVLSNAGTSVGPFDPIDPGDTLLPSSVGTPTAADAPMPAARVDVSIAPNSGAATDTSGVGYLAPADKAKTYSRNFLGSETDSTPYNEYAPFYDAYIPATSRPTDASSGIDGGIANNFNGFLVDGLYHFWDFAATESSNIGSATDCLRSSAADDPQTDSPTSNPGDYFQTPSGASSVSVYTDQHGEAQVQWFPGEGFYFNSLIADGGALLNANGGCDLQSLYKVPDSLGTATITATAVYPYKPVDYPSVSSNSVTKSVTSLWTKGLASFLKGSGAANANSRIVVAHAQNIDGTPFAGETVCFSADAEGVTWFNGTIDGISLAGTSTTTDPKGPTLGRTCVVTDDNGNAAVEVLESDPVTVDVIADFTNEGILRDLDVDFSTTTTTTSTSTTPTTTTTSTTTPTTTTTSATTPTTTTTSTTTPTTTTTSTTTPTTTSSSVTPASKTVAPSATVTPGTTSGVTATTQVLTIHSHISVVRLLTPVSGKHYLSIRVNSNVRTVVVKVLLGRHGQRAKWVTYRIRSNRLVKIAVASSVTKVKEVSLG
jgi:hypothetical protein